jgi:hypothetical protein
LIPDIAIAAPTDRNCRIQLQEGSMNDRPTATHPQHNGAWLALIFFAAMLFFGVAVSIRYAYGWTTIAPDGAAVSVPVVTDGFTVVASMIATAVGTVWFYVRKLAR